MSRPSRILLLLAIVLCSLVAISSAASSTSFCKCTCFTNSTIIQLDGQPASSTKPPSTDNPRLVFPRSPDNDASSSNGGGGSQQKKVVAGGADDQRTQMGHGTCLDCNKKFCLEYNLPICKGATDADVFTTCFQRDSAKDEAVVFIFIFATVGLLMYAALRPWLEKWLANVRERRTYTPVSHAATEES